MKLCKKTLSVILTMLILVSCVNVCFAPITAHAATHSGSDLKAAFQKITNTSDLTNGDGTLLNAADMLYNWAYGNMQTGANSIGGSYDSPSLSAKDYNSIVNLNANAKSASLAGAAIVLVIGILFPYTPST